MAFYVLDENKNLVASFDREGFLAILQQAIEQGTLENIDPDSAVASKLRSNLNGTAHYIEFVTAAQYSELEAQGELVEGTYYFITDDTTEEDLENAIGELQTSVLSLQANKLDKGTYESDFVIDENPFTGDGWTPFDTRENVAVGSGLYLCALRKFDVVSGGTLITVPIFVTNSDTYQDTSAHFHYSESGTMHECFLAAVKDGSGDDKYFRVKEVADGTAIAFFVYAHKIGGTV